MQRDDLLPIGEVAARGGVAPSALRFYEAEGLIASVRTHGNQRRYPRHILRRVAFIRAAQRVGLTLEEIASALSSLPSDRAPTKAQWAHLSKTWRRRLDERITDLEALRDDLTSCIGCGCLSLTTCRLYNPQDGARAGGAGPRYLLGDDAERLFGDPPTGA